MAARGRIATVWNVAQYQIIDIRNGEMLSKHRTKRAAVTAWPSFSGIPVQIFRQDSYGRVVLILEGTWHEGTRW